MRIYGLKPKGEGRFFHCTMQEWGALLHIMRQVNDKLLEETVLDEMAIEPVEISDREISAKFAYRIEAFIDVEFDSNCYVAPFDKETLQKNCPTMLGLKNPGVDENDQFGGPLSPLTVDRKIAVRFAIFLKACGGFITKI